MPNYQEEENVENWGGGWGEGGRKTSSLLSQCVKAGL